MCICNRSARANIQYQQKILFIYLFVCVCLFIYLFINLLFYGFMYVLNYVRFLMSLAEFEEAR